MENISRGPTFRDFVTIHTEGRSRITWLQDYRVQDYRPPSLPFIKCKVVRESLSEDSQNIPCATLNKEKGVVCNLYLSLVDSYQRKVSMQAVVYIEHTTKQISTY